MHRLSGEMIIEKGSSHGREIQLFLYDGGEINLCHGAEAITCLVTVNNSREMHSEVVHPHKMLLSCNFISFGSSNEE